MAEDHLMGDGGGHVSDGELAVFAGDLRVEYDLQKHVAQFVVEGVHIVAVAGVHGFVGFLDEVGAQRLMRLLAIPRAAAGRAKDVDDAVQLVKAVALQLRKFLSLIHIWGCFSSPHGRGR